MGYWSKISWGSSWSFKGYGACRSYDRTYNKKKFWANNDDGEGREAPAYQPEDNNSGIRDGWKKFCETPFRKKRCDDDDDGGSKGWKHKKAWKRWERDEDDDRGGKKFWKKYDKKPVICEPDPEPEPETPEPQPNRAPEITSPALAVVTFTNGKPGIEVATIVATDPDGDTLQFSILDANDTDTADGDFFRIDPNTGVLSFLQNATPKGSQDLDSVYEVGIQVSDGELTDTIMLDVAYLTGA